MIGSDKMVSVLSQADHATLGLPRLAADCLASCDEKTLGAAWRRNPVLSVTQQASVVATALELAAEARNRQKTFSLERLMALYKLTTVEGRLLMELAESLLRVPDSPTRNFLIADKLGTGDWRSDDVESHASTFERLAGNVLQFAGYIADHARRRNLAAMVHRLGLPLIREAVVGAMQHLGRQFVLAETIETALAQTEADASSGAGQSPLYSFDMLGEAARTEDDAQGFFDAYAHAIITIGQQISGDDPLRNHGISIKLSALSCRFRSRYWPECRAEIGAHLLNLARLAREHHVPLSIDAEEIARLEPTLGIFADLLATPEMAGWHGLGMVVQVYNKAAGEVLDWLKQCAVVHGVRLSVRLVKGAYWDNEIKIAQEKGLADFPLFTSKANTDLAYLHHARWLLNESQNLHPQFATHNAFTLAAVGAMAEEIRPLSMEFQKLHGMGDSIHGAFARCRAWPLRIYAPVGRHDDLLAYLVRRILENGANSSFVNQLAEETVALHDLVGNPYTACGSAPLKTGADLFAPERVNSKGYDIDDAATLNDFAQLLETAVLPKIPLETEREDVQIAVARAASACAGWQQTSITSRADLLDRIAALYETEASGFFALLALEAGKTFDDSIAELREAVDFCRFYAAEARKNTDTYPFAAPMARGVVLAISPWNFPLAIFTAQIVAALVSGNTVIAKPAEQTSRIAERAVVLMYRAGVPRDVLHLVIGEGKRVGQDLCRLGIADMVVFTGSHATAKTIEGAIADSVKPHAPLIAETGGINAMIIDATALLERAVDDIIVSAFRSAGQRCSALRIVYVQDDIAALLQEMLIGATQKLVIGTPRTLSVDVGPVIDRAAKAKIDVYIDAARQAGRLIWQAEPHRSEEEHWCFVSPAIIAVEGIADLAEEVFGPVLHFATYPAGGEEAVVEAINARGFGLTFGIQSRIRSSIERISARIRIGNIYVNRNQIGAIVGSQPFGGEGLSGTGPKAGGMVYLKAFTQSGGSERDAAMPQQLNGPDGEENLYWQEARGTLLCIHPDEAVLGDLIERAKGAGNMVVGKSTVGSGECLPTDLNAVLTLRDGAVDLGALRKILAERAGAIIPLISDHGGEVWLIKERHVCTDFTASGGNPELLSRASIAG